MAIEVFNRYENKYMIDSAQKDCLERELLVHMVADKYNRTQESYRVSNIYFDTADHYLIRSSLQKPRYKEKLRLRCYGPLRENQTVYLEIKKKVSSLVNKRRSALYPREAYAFLASGILPDLQPHMNAQVLREIQYLLSQRPLAAKLYLSYERRAYCGLEQPDLRVSFDSNILTRREDLHLESGAYGHALLEEGLWLMEIKTAHNMPLWLARLLSENAVYPTSFSKYGTEYKQFLGDGERRRAVVPNSVPILQGGFQYV